MASHISTNKKGQNCADFMLIFVLLLEEVQNCVTVGTEPFSGTLCVCETVIKSGKLAERLLHCSNRGEPGKSKLTSALSPSQAE